MNNLGLEDLKRTVATAQDKKKMPPDALLPHLDDLFKQSEDWVNAALAKAGEERDAEARRMFKQVFSSTDPLRLLDECHVAASTRNPRLTSLVRHIMERKYLVDQREGVATTKPLILCANDRDPRSAETLLEQMQELIGKPMLMPELCPPDVVHTSGKTKMVMDINPQVKIVVLKHRGKYDDQG